jgi:hypothetical protein
MMLFFITYQKHPIDIHIAWGHKEKDRTNFTAADVAS